MVAANTEKPAILIPLDVYDSKMMKCLQVVAQQKVKY